ncbi:hypothetical protein TKK_0014613 [Trichogramma kaykai]
MSLMIVTKITAKISIQAIKSNPGLYYEDYGSILLKKATWRIAIYLDNTTWTSDNSALNSYVQLERHCYSTKTTPSCELFKSSSVVKQFNIIKKMQDEIALACLTTTQSSVGRNLITNARLRKSAPLAIIGTISKSLFGTATEDEISIIQQSLHKLSGEQSAIIKLSKEKTHLLMHSMDVVANATQQHDTILKELEEIMQDETSELEHLHYEVRLLAHLSAIEREMDERIGVLERMQIILRELREGRVPPQLLTPSLAREIATDIQQNNPDLHIPIPTEHLRPEEILKISKADMIYVDKRTIAIIYIPLTERNHYILYKLHPLEIPQISPDNVTIDAAFIRPTHPFLLLSENRKQYTMYDTEDLDRCLQGHSNYICPIQSPIREAYLSKECEINLVINPSNANLKDCPIMVTPNLDTQWHYLSHEGSWLYSVMKTEKIEVICPTRHIESTKISGIGILHIPPGCHARTRDHLLETEEVRESRHNYIYSTEIHLNVTDLFPQLETDRNLSSILMSNTATTWSKDAVRIETILGKIDAVEAEAREKKSTISIVAGGFGTQLILTAGIITLIVYLKKRIPNIQVRHPNSKPKVRPSMNESPTEQEMSEIPRQNVLS